MIFLLVNIITIFVLVVNSANSQNKILDLQVLGVSGGITETSAFFIMKEILLNTTYKSSPDYKKYVALVDDEDYEKLIKYNWSIKRAKNSEYARGKVEGKNVYMHKLITGFALTDHIDRNGLNNQKYNLREATRAENCRNCKKYRNSSSKYKGVAYRPETSKWRSYIRVNGKLIHGGQFKSEKEAGQRYNELARLYFGEFARLNIIS